MRLNLLALAIIAFGSVLAAVLGRLLGMDPAATLGVLTGATTNTPSLGAAQQTLATVPGVAADRLALPALAYAVTYPAAIVGIIGTLILLRRLCGVDPVAEGRAFEEEQLRGVEPLERRTLVIESPELHGIALGMLPGLAASGAMVSRLRRETAREVHVAQGGTLLEIGDRLLVVGRASALDALQRVVGRASDEDLLAAPGGVTYRRVVVTDERVLGKTVSELGLAGLGVVVTRVTRGDVELTAVPGLRLKFGDVLQVVGPAPRIEEAAALLGNSVKHLSETHFIPFFLGIFAGILLGTRPFSVPGLPQPVRLGLAGGPLLIALLLGRIGHLGRLVWHMPLNANLAFREFGISLFLAAVGLAAGPRFFGTVFSTAGLTWLSVGLCVTVVPLLVVGLFARLVLRTNFTVLTGVLAGSVTDPPALAFATGMARSDAPNVAYATVYPLAMLLRIVIAQILTLLLCS
jgi:putative transport protein